MKIAVSRVPEEGLTEHATYDPSILDMEREDIHLTEPFEVNALITKADEELVIRVDIRCPVRCSRASFSAVSTTARQSTQHAIACPDKYDFTAS